MMMNKVSESVEILFHVQTLKQDKWANGEDMSLFGECSEYFHSEWREWCLQSVYIL